MKPISNYLFTGNIGDRGTSLLLAQGMSNFPRTDDWYFQQMDCMKIKEEGEGGKKGGREEGRRLLQNKKDLHDNQVQYLCESC